MYTRHFGLKQEPFSLAPDPRYLFMSERHREALAHLLYGVRAGSGGFVVLTGEIGAGKTTVARCLLEQIPDGCNVGYIFNPKLTVTELLRSICDEFRIERVHLGDAQATVKDYVDALNAYLLATHGQGQSNVLIIDEAQNLSTDVLEQLRLLTNLETNERKLLQIILVGQPELRAMLARPDMEQLAQRVIARYHLEPLSEGETAYYLRHRLAVAGMTGIIPFDREARKRIHELTRGVPRRINLLADRALLGAYAKEMPRVNRAVVDQAAREVFDATATPTLADTASAWRRPAWITAAVLAAAGLVGMGWWLRDSARDSAGDTSPRVSSTSDDAAPAERGMAKAASASAVAVPAAAVPPPTASKVPGTTSTSTGAAPPLVPATAALPASTPSSAAAATATAVVPAAPVREFVAAPAALLAGPEIDRFVATLPTDETIAWRQLAALWRIDATGDASAPCPALQARGVYCHRSTASALARIRMLDRPGIVRLQRDKLPAVHALLTAISDDTVTLRAGDRVRQMPQAAFAKLWQGEFATLWRVPAGWAGAQDGSLSPATRSWIAQGLARIEGQGVVTQPASDEALKARVQAFQKANGLPGGGLAGPMTLMLINRATGVDEPRLTSGALPVQMARGN